MNSHTPAEAFPPGDFLLEELDAREWSQVEFAEIIDRPTKLVNEIIKNKRGITPETAMDFAAALGTSAEFWLNLETSYQHFKAAMTERSGRDNAIARKAALHEKFPVRDMIKKGWVEESESPTVLECRVLEFFGIENIEDDPVLKAAAKRNYVEELSQKQLAWLFRVKQIASHTSTPKYSKAKLLKALSDIELLTESAEEIRHVPKILANCGVRLIVVEPPKGSKICGVCFWIENDSAPVIGLTLLHDRIDNLWFTLRHEIEHVIRGDGKQEVIIDVNGDDGGLTSGAGADAEKAANDAAQDFCVPRDEMTGYIVRNNPIYTADSVKGFAKRIHRHPGLVVGQLHNNTRRWSLLRDQLVKIRHIIIKTAVTDGYGVRAILRGDG